MSSNDLTYLLARLIANVPHARSAVLLSNDGLAKFWHGLTKEEADTLSAIASSQRSLAQQVSARFCSGSGGVRQVACELDDGILLVASASEGSALAVLAETTVDTGILSYQMAHLAKQVPEHLATAPRGGGPVPGAGGYA